MIEKQQNEYCPDVVSPPGDTLAELLEERGMSQAELATRMGCPHKTINEIVNGKTAITPDTALQLERVLGAPARFWLQREQHYQEWRARQQDDTQLRAELDWLEQLPVQEMIKLGWIRASDDPMDRMRVLLSFFGVASPGQWRQVWQQPKAAFRHTQAFTSELGAMAAWLRKGQMEAQVIECAPYDSQTLPMTSSGSLFFMKPVIFCCTANARCFSTKRWRQRTNKRTMRLPAKSERPILLLRNCLCR